MSDLERAFAAIEAKQDVITTLWQYYDGDQPLIYSTKRLDQVFRNLNARFNQNWCAVVIDSVMDRLNMRGFSIQNEQQDQTIDAVFNRERIVTDVYDVHEAALVASEAYVIAWQDDETGEIEVYYNDPRIVHMFYNASRPKEKEFAAKMWQESTGEWKITLYYADRLEYYRTSAMKPGRRPTKPTAFKADDPDQAPNPFGVIPVFHWRLNRRKKKSELDNVITLQDAVNKLLADMMVAAEFGAYKQRWIISNSDTDNLRNSPGMIWEIPAGDGVGQPTQVGEFNETNLDMYLNSIDKLVNSIAIITRTPKHYFMSTGANVSGDALIAMESPLVKKVERFQELFGSVWIEMAQFILSLSGIEVSADDISITWERPESVQPVSEAQGYSTSVSAGIPLTTVLQRSGWDKTEIDAMLEEKQQEQTRAQSSLARALLDAERDFNRGENNGE